MMTLVDTSLTSVEEVLTEFFLNAVSRHSQSSDSSAQPVLQSVPLHAASPNPQNLHSLTLSTEYL